MSFERVRRPRLIVLAAAGLILALAAPASAADPAPDDPVSSSPKSAHSKAVHHDTSPALRDIAPAELIDRFTKKKRDRGSIPLAPTEYAPDGVTQTDVGTTAAPALGSSFDGIGVGMTNADGTPYAVRWAPPDTAGAVGPRHFVEIVNTEFAIFAKDGSIVMGARPSNTIWAGFGGSCQDRNDGDGTVEYDSIADRWVISQFATSGPPYYQCVAVSTTGDPTGSYHRYAFQYQDFPDYPKLGVWPDAYYTTFNMFRTGFAGAYACAYDRAKMLAGLAATQQCVNLGVAYASLLPADLDGPTLPPANAPGYLMNIGTSSLRFWKFDVDWLAPANTRLIGPTSLSVAPFSVACNGGACIPQPGTTQRLASLGDRLMYRLAYRNFGTHESLVVNHAIKTGTFGTGPSGIRWYEVRLPGGTPVVYQQGTYAPDSTYRWMGSAAMDKAGNLAIGYSASSSTVKPSLRWAGRLATDAPGTLAQGEGEIYTGTGVQLPNLDRWGDYTALSVDPVDDCTFWFVGQYLMTDGTWNWHTRIASWKFPNCPPVPPPPDETDPTILSVAPPETPPVAPDTNVTVMFDEPMNQGSAERSFSITPDVAGSFSWTGNTMTFDPTADLAAGTPYNAAIEIDPADPVRDTSDNTLEGGRSWTFTTRTVTTYTAAPSSVTREVGTLRANGVAQLGVSDNAYYQVNSSKSGGTQATQWAATFTGVSNDLANLKVTHEGHSSRTATQTIWIFRASTGAWVQLDPPRSVGTTDVLVADLVPAGTMLGDYVTGNSGPGDLRIRVRATRGSNGFFTSGDLLRIVYDAP